jgi:uncharacterized damage-inducible protein DinB
MLFLVDQLLRHKWWANTDLLRVPSQHQPAAEDPELRKLLHHVIVSNRYWTLLVLDEPFIDEQEKRIPDSHSILMTQVAETERIELDWLSRATPEELDRQLQPRALPGTTISVPQAMIQVSLHSHGHRSQCTSRLRALGGTPAPMDFVLWVQNQNSAS